VLWAANMAFLSVNYIDTPQIVTSITSTLFALASMICSLLCIRQHRSKVGGSAAHGSVYLDQANSKVYGLLPLATALSLPFVFLYWSIVTFAVAILQFAFAIPSVGLQLWLGCLAAVILLAIVMTVYFFWMHEEDEVTIPQRLGKVSRRVGRQGRRMSITVARSMTSGFETAANWVRSRQTSAKARRNPRIFENGWVSADVATPTRTGMITDLPMQTSSPTADRRAFQWPSYSQRLPTVSWPSRKMRRTDMIEG